MWWIRPITTITVWLEIVPGFSGGAVVGRCHTDRFLAGAALLAAAGGLLPAALLLGGDMRTACMWGPVPKGVALWRGERGAPECGRLFIYSKCMQHLPGAKALVAVLVAAIVANAENSTRLPSHETLTYGIEWRLISAGIGTLNLKQSPPAANQGWSANLRLESAGLVSKLYKVIDLYRSNYEGNFCATDTFLDASEGKRHRETTVKFDRSSAKASYLEKDLVKNSIVKQTEVAVPPCVKDILGGFYHLRTLQLQPGQSATVRMSDGKKSADVRVEAQEWEEIKTKAGKFKTMRYEAFLFNGVLFERAAKLHIWVSDDEKRLPVQIKLKLSVAVGTITLQLEKEERI